MSATYHYFSIYDSAVKMYMRPWPARSVEEAARSFRQAVGAPENDYAKSPGDYTLFYVAEWREVDAQFVPLTAPVLNLS